MCCRPWRSALQAFGSRRCDRFNITVFQIDLFSGFIAKETKETDDLGLMEVRKHTNRRGGGKAAEKKRKQLQRTKYVFVQASRKERKYKDYFNPDITVEGKLLGLDQLVCSSLATRIPVFFRLEPAHLSHFSETSEEVAAHGS